MTLSKIESVSDLKLSLVLSFDSLSSNKSLFNPQRREGKRRTGKYRSTTGKNPYPEAQYILVLDGVSYPPTWNVYFLPLYHRFYTHKETNKDGLL